MGRFLRLGLVLIPAMLAALAWAPARAALLDTVLRDAQGQSQPLQRVVSGRAAIVVLVDAAGHDTAAWLVRTLSAAAPEVQRNVVVVFASHRAQAAWPQVDLAKFPDVRLYMDADGEFARTGAVRVFPSVLGLGPDGAVRSRMAGPMATAVNLNALAAHVRAGAMR